MLTDSRSFSSFSTNDMPATKSFYSDTLGLSVSEENGVLMLDLQGGQRLMIYHKDDHQPATFTILNFETGDIEGTVDRLSAAGVEFERYGEEFGQDERGIASSLGPRMAWFKDPADNIVAIIQT